MSWRNMRNLEDLNFQFYEPSYIEVTKMGRGYRLTYVEWMVILAPNTGSILHVFYSFMIPLDTNCCRPKTKLHWNTSNDQKDIDLSWRNMRNLEDLNLQFYEPSYIQVTKMGRGYRPTYVDRMVILTPNTGSILHLFYSFMTPPVT